MNRLEPAICRYASIALISCVVHLNQCSQISPLAGGSAETVNAHVTGFIVDTNGKPVTDASIRLYPVDFNPVAAAFMEEGGPDVRAKTDTLGKYSFSTKDTGVFNIEAVHPEKATRLLIPGITINRENLTVPPDTLKLPGKIILSLHDSLRNSSAFVYIEGTGIYQALDSATVASGIVTLDSVPAGMMHGIRYTADSAVVSSILLSDSVRVKPSEASIASRPGYDAVRALSAPVIDCVLSEYDHAAAITLVDTTVGTRAVYKIIWDNSAVYIAATVTDPLLNVDSTNVEDGDLWMDDAIEIMFDTKSDRHEVMQEDDFKFYVNIKNLHSDRKGIDTTWDGEYESAVIVKGTINDNADIDTGYIMEIRIPWTTLGVPAPSAGGMMGFEIIHNERDRIETNVDLHSPWANVNGREILQQNWDEVSDPRGWGDIRFVE